MCVLSIKVPIRKSMETYRMNLVLNLLFEMLELDWVQGMVFFYGSRITHLDVIQGSRSFPRRIRKHCSEIANQTKNILLSTTR